MKILYTILLSSIIIFSSKIFSQNVNYQVRVTELKAEGDSNDGSGVAGEQDPTWYVWAKDNSNNIFNADICKHTTNIYGNWWDVDGNPYTLITGSNSNATQITIEMECWEEDGDPWVGCDADECVYTSCSFWNSDDNYTGRAVAISGIIDFKNDPACQWNEYEVSIPGDGGSNHGDYYARIQIKWEYATFSAGNDDSVCDSTVSLAAQGNGTWSVTSGTGGFFSNNNDPLSSFTGQSGETYTLTWQTLSGCINSSNTDDVIIEIYGLPDPMLTSTEDSICEGDNVTFTAQNGTSYDWFINTGGSVLQSGSTNTFSTSSLIQSDTIYVNMTDANSCTAMGYYTIDVSPIPTLDLGNDTTICLGNPFTIDGTTPFVTYLWNNNETTSSIDITSAGSYSLIIENSYGCTTTDSINISLYNNIVVDLGPDTTYYEFDSLTLDAGSGFTSYLWSTGGITQMETIFEFDAYWVETTDINGCVSSDTIIIGIIENNMFIPNMFSPNNDGSNETFNIYGNDLDEEISFKIYNRWGNVVYETNLLSDLKNIGWDGKYNNIDQPSGVYLWTMVANYINGDPVILKNLQSGSILLKR